MGNNIARNRIKATNHPPSPLGQFITGGVFLNSGPGGPLARVGLNFRKARLIVGDAQYGHQGSQAEAGPAPAG